MPAPPPRRLPSKPSTGLTVGLCLAAALVTALLLGSQTVGRPETAAARGIAQARTAIATEGVFGRTLRVGGTIETLDFAAIRAPRMRGPRDSGRADLTLVKLAGAGSLVERGSVVAEFELKWLEDHIEDRQSVVTTARAQFRKLEADILILKETERQARVSAKAEHDKALLDLQTAEVRSAIEAEILKNVADESRATWQQLESEGQLQQVVHGADLRVEELKVQEEILHVERHERDFTRLRIKTPLGGMVVLESMFGKNGQFAQTKAGDQVYPGTLFMRIVDVSNMVVTATVNQVDAQSIRIGNEAVVELDAYPGERFKGRVAEIGAVASSGGGRSRYSRGGAGDFVKHIPVRVLITDSDERILPDLSASADIRISERRRGVVVPREAVRKEAGSDAEIVYIREGDGYLPRRVRVQEFSDTEALVAAGLSGGEEVLLSEPLSERES